ncbi:3104_t:CDS:2, partial [Racocetra persica]
FLIYNVAKNPSILKNIHEEIFKVFGSDINSVVTYENLEKCHYITTLVKETLRHTNPSPLNIRALEGEENTDKYHLNFSEEHGGTSKFKLSKNEFVAFGGGLRMCPGRNIALIELKLLVVLFY